MTQILPATQTLGSLDPHVLQVELPTYLEADVHSALDGSGDIKPAQILAHELCHWFDIVGTVWGQNYLSLLFKAFDDSFEGIETASYPSALAMFDADREILFPSYYKYVAATAVAARGPGTWQIEMTTGARINSRGIGDEDHPIFFVRFGTLAGEIGRQPLTVGALLELRALQAEMMAFGFGRMFRNHEERIVDEQIYKNELLAILYYPELITYSAAAHLLAYAIGGKDINGVLFLGGQISDIALNLTSETFRSLRIPEPIAACGERRRQAFVANHDRGYAFAAMSFWLNEMVAEQVREKGFQEALRKAGFVDLDSIYGPAEEYIRSLTSEGLRNLRLRDIRDKTLGAGRSVIAYRRTRGSFFQPDNWPELPSPPIMDANLNIFWVGHQALSAEDAEFLHECDGKLKDRTRQALRAGRGFDFSFTDYVY